MKILFVCTGNICRSPTAEGVLRGKLRRAGLEGEIEIDSAGTQGWHVGSPPDPRAVSHAGKRGYPIAGLVARKLTRKDLQAFDMVIAMDRGHYREMLRLSPTAGERLFHFMEFAPQASKAAGMERLDVPDPYYGTDEDFSHALDLIEAGAEGILEALMKSGLNRL